MPASLEGEWRIAGIGGQDINLPHGISASITPARITVTSGCVELGWCYTYSQGQLRTQALPGQGCERTLDVLEEQILRGVSGAVRVQRTPANGVELTGTGPAILLFSQ